MTFFQNETIPHLIHEHHGTFLNMFI